MNKAVIFGAGERGKYAYHKLSRAFDIVAYSDNKSILWGKEVNGVKVIPPNELPELSAYGMKVFICTAQIYYDDIAEQLNSMSVPYLKGDGESFFEIEGEFDYPVSFYKEAPYKKESESDFSVLYVQSKPCARTIKIASAMKSIGVKTYSAVTLSETDSDECPFEKEYLMWTFADILEFVNESQFDLVHCSNAPDMLVNVLLHSNKRVVHDCHDMVTIERKGVLPEERVLEYIANSQADGCMYPTEGLRDVAVKKYGIDPKKTFVVGNYPPDSFFKVRRLPKLSQRDGEIHLVYEGGIGDKDCKMTYRYLQPIFELIASKKIHVHFFSPAAFELCQRIDSVSPYIHYEGNYKGTSLIERLTQYDIGSALFNLQNGLTQYHTVASANKIYEYICAGLPVVSNIPCYTGMLKDCGAGGELMLNENIITQMNYYREIDIPRDLLQRHGMTMGGNSERILAFYKYICS